MDYFFLAIVIVGELNKECVYCGALKFNDESQGLCCLNGKIKLQVFTTPPEPVKSLLPETTHEPSDFSKKIRTYNKPFAMTSFQQIMQH